MGDLHVETARPSRSVDNLLLSLKIRSPLQPRIANDTTQSVYDLPSHAAQEQQRSPSAMAFWSVQPRQQRSGVLKKTRNPYRDGAEKSGYQQHPDMPSTVRPIAASVSIPLPPRRDQSPGTEQLRGRSPSAQPRLTNTIMAPSPLVRPSFSGASATPSATPSATGHGSRPASQSSSDTRSARSAHSPSCKDQPRKRRGWLSGGNTRLRSKLHAPMPSTESPAWVLSGDTRADYNVICLLRCEKVPELWDDNGSLYVYLSPQQSDKGPSFKVPYSIIEQSRVLGELVQGRLLSPDSAYSHTHSFDGRDNLMAADAERAPQSESPPPSIDSEARLYLPVQRPGSDGAAPDLDRLVSLRNLFALLTGQRLVATRAFPTAFTALTQVVSLLREFEFGAISGGGSSFGEAAGLSIGFYVDQNGLADVRFSLDKTLEALVLGEQLRFWPLYNEAFCHAVGKYSALRARTSPLWDKVSHSTRQRLERANLDLVSRQQSVNTRLEQFEFPSLFAGVANSSSNLDYRNIRFKNWRSSFYDMRSFTLKYYKTKFGSWPPKANSKRNHFTESGLNRLVLKTLYADLCSVYDLLVDRQSITTRVGEDGLVSGVSASAATAASAHPHKSDPTMMALRQMLAEFDTSSPPVLPPIPFDVPKLPLMSSVNEKFSKMSPKDQTRFEKNIQSNDFQQLVLKSHNPDAERGAISLFLAAFETFELREAKGKSETELAEMRIGHWLFLYVVLQSIPMLVIDAPGLRFSEGTEYFLCEPPQGYPPWVEDAGEVRKAWFQTAGGAGPLVQLSEDVLLFSVEATHHRSHCWLAAKEWEAKEGIDSAHGAENVFDIASFGVPSSARPATAPAPPAAPGTGSHWPLEPAPELTPPTTAYSPQSPPAVDNGTGLLSRSPSPRNDYQDYQQQGRLSPTQPLRQGSVEEQRQRARLRHASIGWKLEPVDYLTDNAMVKGGDARFSRRVVSVNNLRTLQEDAPAIAVHAPDAAGAGPGAGIKSNSTVGEFFNAESTFDAILGSIDDGKKKKKRSSFLPF